MTKSELTKARIDLAAIDTEVLTTLIKTTRTLISVSENPEQRLRDALIDQYGADTATAEGWINPLFVLARAPRMAI